MSFEIEDGILKAYHPEPREESITIPENVKVIGKSAFRDCWELKKIIIPDGVAEIQDFAFSQCTALEHIFIPASVHHIGKRAFHSGVTLSVENPVYEVIDNIIYQRNPKRLICGTSLQPDVVRIPEGTEEIADFSFEDVPIRELYIPASVSLIGRRVFCQVQEIHVDEKNPCYTVQDNVLYDKEIKTLLFCAEETAFLPESVKEITDFAFRNVGDIKSIRLPDGVTHVGNFAFWCGNMKEIFYRDMHFKTQEIITRIVEKNTDKRISQQIHNFIYDTDQNHSQVSEEEYSAQEAQYSDFEMLMIKIIHALMQIAVNRNFDFPCPDFIKYLIMMQMFSHYPEDTDLIQAFQKQMSAFFPFFAEQEDKISTLQKILDERKFITKHNIDDLIVWTIEHKEYDLQLMLMDYKEKYIGYDSDDEIIRRKFDL